MYRIKIEIDGKTVVLATVAASQLEPAIAALSRIWPGMYIEVKLLQDKGE